MHPNLQMIFGFLLATLLIVMPSVYVFIRAEAKHKERKLELQARIEEAKAAKAMQRATRQNIARERRQPIAAPVHAAPIQIHSRHGKQVGTTENEMHIPLAEGNRIVRAKGSAWGDQV